MSQIPFPIEDAEDEGTASELSTQGNESPTSDKNSLPVLTEKSELQRPVKDNVDKRAFAVCSIKIEPGKHNEAHEAVMKLVELHLTKLSKDGLKRYPNYDHKPVLMIVPIIKEDQNESPKWFF